jgi:hypothetical protein
MIRIIGSRRDVTREYHEMILEREIHRLLAYLRPRLEQLEANAKANDALIAKLLTEIEELKGLAHRHDH